METLLVVGGMFGTFRRNAGVITIDELKQIARAGRFDELPKGTRLVPGLGVREADIELVLEQARACSPAIDLSLLEQRPVRASRRHVHKHRLQNSIVSQPVKLADDLYETRLLLDERSELMSDHQTGQHIQGMVLIEAARQTMLAVTEEFFIGEDAASYYFVLNGFDVAFNSFVFPVDVSLQYRIKAQNIERRDRLKFDSVTSVMQNGECVTTVGIAFTAFLSERIEAKEQQQALMAIRAQAQRVQQAFALHSDTAQAQPPHRLAA